MVQIGMKFVFRRRIERVSEVSSLGEEVVREIESWFDKERSCSPISELPKMGTSAGTVWM